jgi:hypothetical protein
MSNCEYCKKDFSHNKNLIKHQKTAKYCLKIQKELNVIQEEEIKVVIFHCIYCDKNLTSKENLHNHHRICINKYKKNCTESETKNKELSSEIVELKHKLDILQTKNDMLEKQMERSTSTVEEIAKQPKIQNTTTTTNNTKILIATPLDLSKEGLVEMIQNGFSHEYLIMGQKGVAKFAYENILRDEQGRLKYICTDSSRQIFQYKNDDGTVQKDVKAAKLTKALFDGEIKKTSHKIAWAHMENAGNEEFMQYTNYYQDIQAMEIDNTKFSKELTSLVV